MHSNLSAKIKELRISHRMSQEQVARELGITRPTYMNIETGTRDITIAEASRLAELFGVPLEKFVLGKSAALQPKVSLAKEAVKAEKAGVRVNVPQQNQRKFREVLLYVLEKVGALPHVGETVIYKLLYFIDFDYYEKFEEQLVGATYMKNKYGPTPVEFRKIVDRMAAKNEIAIVKNRHFQYDQKKYLPLRNPDLRVLTGREIDHINEVLARLGGKNAAQLSEYSHDDVPWITTEDGKAIEYEAVFYRTPKTSVRNYEPAPI
jgi:transcriptional regulator with XRE-family HTH domain